MIDDYFDALEARIQAGQGLADKVYDTVRTDAAGGLTRANYVVLYAPVALDVPQTRYTLPATFDGDVEFEADLRVVGISQKAVRQMLSAVMRQTVGFNVTITGRQPALTRFGSQSRVRPDESVKPFLFYADASIEWTSRPE